MPETQASRHILDQIVESKRAEVATLARSASQLRDRAEEAPAPRDFVRALTQGHEVAVIAEVKRRSPGAGVIRGDLDPVDQAQSYEGGGASAVSVLTDGPFFGGSLSDLEGVRQATSLPVLRKDFVIDPVQVYEARSAGADAILLIVRILEDSVLRDLQSHALELGMAALVEVHDQVELDRALAADARLVGINNRDLRSFTTDLKVTLRLLDGVPSDVVLVSESGVRGPADVHLLGRAGVDAVLVGEWLVRQADPEAAAGQLARQQRVSRSR